MATRLYPTKSTGCATTTAGREGRDDADARDVEKQNVISFDRPHRPAGFLLHAGAYLSRLEVALLSGSLRLPERHSDGCPGQAVTEHAATGVSLLAADARVNDVTYNLRDVSDTLRRRLENVESR
jgi:hypothetical protein